MMGLSKQVMHLLVGIYNYTIHYCKRSANSLANILANLDAPIIASNGSVLPFQARDIYIDEHDRTNAYTRAFFKDPFRDEFSSTLTANHHRTGHKVAVGGE